ncbi:MAG: hypothetical protein P8X87_07295 [Candidatus Bathyarchaeota archaeon]
MKINLLKLLNKHRFEPTFGVLEETIQETFFNEETEFTIVPNDEFKIKVEKGKKIWGEMPLLEFNNANYSEFEKDAFLTVAIRNNTGIPIPKNIARLRNFVKKLKEKVDFEVW